MTANLAPARALVDSIVSLGLGERETHAALDMMLDELSTTELAALAYDWRGTWARPNQLFDAGGRWRSHGFLTARRFGKTRSNVEHAIEEAAAGRAMRIGFAAQTIDKGIEVMVEGDCGFVACSPPWFPARWESDRVIWPNGAQAFPFTPEVPGNIRGPGVHLFLASEIQSWPKATMEEAFSNATIMTSLGYARMLWDATPKRRHPILLMLIARAASDPKLHHLVRGSIEENRDNLGAGVIDDLAKQIGIGTVRGREELGGEMVSEADGLISEEWISKTRRHLPDTFRRRVIACDPSITEDRRFSDRSGIVDMGVGVDEQIYVCRNLTARIRAEKLGAVLVGAYLDAEASLLVIETNRGGTLPTGLVRIAARERGFEVVVVDAIEKPPPRAGTIYVREVNNRGKKAERLGVGASLLSRLVISFVIGGVGLVELEEQLLALDGSEKGPDDGPDAFAMGAVELSDAARDKDLPVGERTIGIGERIRAMQAAMAHPAAGLNGSVQGAAHLETPRIWRGAGRNRTL